MIVKAFDSFSAFLHRVAPVLTFIAGIFFLFSPHWSFAEGVGFFISFLLFGMWLLAIFEPGMLIVFAKDKSQIPAALFPFVLIGLFIAGIWDKRFMMAFWAFIFAYPIIWFFWPTKKKH